MTTLPRQRQNDKWKTAFKYPVGQSPPPLFNQKGNYGYGKEVNGFEGFCAFPQNDKRYYGGRSSRMQID
jgi:hypothetical protein